MNGIIYMRVAPNGKRYIGQTKQKEERRWAQHVNDAYSDDETKRKLPLSRAIRKYGAESFTLEILESGIKTQELLDEREVFWIKEYHSQIKEKMGGLNVTIGGDGYKVFTDDDFQKYYDEGYSISEIAKITGAHPSTVSAHTNGDKFENYSRCRRSALKRNPPKSVSNYDVNTCEKVMTFASTAEASLYYFGIREASYITGAINGPAASAAGFLWKYDDEPMSALYERYEMYHNQNNHNTRGLPVVNIETNEVFPSALAASNKYNISRYSILSCCKGMREDAGGYHWKFDGQEQKVYKGGWSKPIICIDTGVVYPSVSKAARETHININLITDCLKGRRENAGGLRWKYKNEETANYINNDTRFKPVICLDTGEIYPTTKDACAKNHIDRTMLVDNINGKREDAKGLHFKYYEKE